MRIIIGSLVILKGLNVYSNQSGSFACAARAAVASASGCTFFQEEVNYSNAVSTASSALTALLMSQLIG